MDVTTLIDMDAKIAEGLQLSGDLADEIERLKETHMLVRRDLIDATVARLNELISENLSLRKEIASLKLRGGNF